MAEMSAAAQQHVSAGYRARLSSPKVQFASTKSVIVSLQELKCVHFDANLPEKL